ncbi:MAG: DUF4340 domain-containing protein [Clostridia bacterium]|nr:DUF4340 domain-containing protein [Clostridia bacterium]
MNNSSNEKAAAGAVKASGRGRRRRSVLKEQRTAIIVLAAVIAVLAVAIPLVFKFIINVNIFTDVDGEKYYVVKVAGKYSLCSDRDGTLLDVTKDGYYVTTKASTLVEVDEKTGEYKIFAVVDTEDGETLGTSNRILMYNHTSQANIQSVEVHNSYGTFTFYRDADDKFTIKGFEGTPYIPTMFSSLAVSSGYTLTMQKIDNPIKDADGKFTEYGLAKQQRKDSEGNEDTYEPNGYRMLDVNGNSYAVYIGDAIPSGAGYYVQYVGRDAVYIMNYSVDSSVLSMYDTTTVYPSVENIMDLPVESFVSPSICYPMTLNTYFDVQNFSVFRDPDLERLEKDPTYDLKPVVSFSFWDMDERFGTFYHSRAYVLNYPKNYLVNTTATDSALQSFYSMHFIGVTKLGPTEEDLKKYGLENPAFVVFFTFQEVDHYIAISKMTDRGTYYVASALYDMIVEVDRTQLLFLDYGLYDWVDRAYFDMNIAWLRELIVETDGMTYHFFTDNSKSDSMSNPTCSETAKKNNTIASNLMTMEAEDSTGRRFKAFSSYSVTDASGVTWTVTADKVTVTDKNGNNINSITGAKYEKNALGNDVVVLLGSVTGTDGTKILVGANEVTIIDPNGHSETYLRYGMSIFRKFYQSILYASLEGDVHDGTFGLTDEAIAGFLADPDKDVQTKITIKTTAKEMPEYVYRYYAYSERRSMITVNGGNGEFYVLRSFTDKLTADAERVMKGEAVDPTSKY